MTNYLFAVSFSFVFFTMSTAECGMRDKIFFCFILQPNTAFSIEGTSASSLTVGTKFLLRRKYLEPAAYLYCTVPD